MLTLISCGFWTNFTTYFNTYYNAERLITESEKEFEYQDEKTRAVKPRTHIPKYKILKEDTKSKGEIPPFMAEFIISKAKLQPVRVKLDSVLIKGSKILAKKSESDFIEGTLFLMAQAYFYRSEWLPCEVKCGELIDIYPDGDKSPDAHLLLAKSLLIQKKFDYGKKILSRTVDIAWQLERYDILSEAFRLQADLAIYQGEREEALRPYRQAVAQSSDSRLKAKWQLDMAVLLFELRQFDRAEKAFEKVYVDFNPEYVQLFEAKLYRGISLAKIGEFEESNKLIMNLENDGKFEEWLDYSKVARLFLLKEKLKDKSDTTVNPMKLDSAERYADTSMVGQTLLMAYQYDRGVDEYYKSNYPKAKFYMDKARRRRTDIFEEATEINRYLGDLLNNQAEVVNYINVEKNYEKYNPSQYDKAAKSAFWIGRVYEKFGREDSVEFYYRNALHLSSPNDPERPRYLWAYSREIRDEEPIKADSLLQVIVDDYPNTEYSVESSKLLGFTDAYLIDTAKELYTSGVENRKYGNFDYAINQFLKCASNHPKSEYAPKSLYHAGWIFENEQRRPDSAMKYYRILVDNYPNSVYADDIRMSLAYIEKVLLNKEIPDSLNASKLKKNTVSTMTKEEIEKKYKYSGPDGTGNREESGGFFNRAKKFLQKQLGGAVDSTINNINSQVDKVKEVQKLDPRKLKDVKLEDLQNTFMPSDTSQNGAEKSPTETDSTNNRRKKEL